MELSLFSVEDFNQYHSWLQDPRLRATLGDIDHEWLKYILSDTSGAEWTLKDNGQLLAVVGITYATEENPYYVINNICSNPKYCQLGYTSTALKMVMKRYTLTEEQFWTAYVAHDNVSAQIFFEKNGWKSVNKEKELITYRHYLETHI